MVKIIGIVAVIGGSVALFLSSVDESIVVSIVGAVFVLAGLIAQLFKVNKTE